MYINVNVLCLQNKRNKKKMDKKGYLFSKDTVNVNVEVNGSAFQLTKKSRRENILPLTNQRKSPVTCIGQSGHL